MFNFLYILSSENFKVEVIWDLVLDGFVYGILLGYCIYFLMVLKIGENIGFNIKVIIVGFCE